MIFDAGVFIALERKSTRRVVVALVEELLNEQLPIRSTDVVLAQSWRDPARQVAMARMVKGVDRFPFGDPQTIGARCAKSKTSDVVDADLAIWAEVLDDTVLTTDPVDMAKLDAPFVQL